MTNIELLYLYYSVVVGQKWSKDNHLSLYLLVVHCSLLQCSRCTDSGRLYPMVWPFIVMIFFIFISLFIIHFFVFIYSLSFLGQWPPFSSLLFICFYFSDILELIILHYFTAIFLHSLLLLQWHFSFSVVSTLCWDDIPLLLHYFIVVIYSTFVAYSKIGCSGWYGRHQSAVGNPIHYTLYLFSTFVIPGGA